MPVDVRPARSFRDVGAFIDLPSRLHAGTPWVPPLKLERRLFLSRRFGPYRSRIDFEQSVVTDPLQTGTSFSTAYTDCLPVLGSIFRE